MRSAEVVAVPDVAFRHDETVRPSSGSEYGARMSELPRSVFQPDVLASQVVFVTGGATGIGKEIARVCGRHGARVAIASRKRENLDAAQAELAAEGIECHVDTFDVRDANGN